MHVFLKLCSLCCDESSVCLWFISVLLVLLVHWNIKVTASSAKPGLRLMQILGGGRFIQWDDLETEPIMGDSSLKSTSSGSFFAFGSQFSTLETPLAVPQSQSDSLKWLLPTFWVTLVGFIFGLARLFPKPKPGWDLANINSIQWNLV